MDVTTDYTRLEVRMFKARTAAWWILKLLLQKQDSSDPRLHRDYSRGVRVKIAIKDLQLDIQLLLKAFYIKELVNSAGISYNCFLWTVVSYEWVIV